MIKRFFHYFIAIFADIFYGMPSRRLVVIGVTGTKGKSTTCRYIASVLEAGGYKVGLMTTVEFQIADKRWMNDKKMSMLGRGQIQKMLRQMVKAGCEYAVIETSSEGILQHRHVGINYDVAVFTNLAPEHAERHGGFENLKRDKGKLFASLKNHGHKRLKGKIVPKIIAANADDANANYYLEYWADQKVSYCLNNIQYSMFNICGKIVQSDTYSSVFEIGDRKYEILLPGKFNVYNALAAVAVGRSQGMTDEQIASGLKNVALVPGRMEFIEEGQPFKVIVDYAHEPLSLTELFTTLKQMLFGTDGKAIAVIGSDGGGRDKGKRHKMGKIAGELCDYAVITDVNCFDEDPKEIAEMLASGAREAGKKDGVDLFIEVDRRKGIELAIKLAKPGDIVVITAKGTEPVICVAGGKKMPWDDRVVARDVIKALKH